MVSNIASGLFIGFTFFKAKDTLQGTHNKLFALFLGLLVCVSITNQLQIIFIKARNVYEIRERPSRMYSWTALLTSQLLAELPWNILGSSSFFFTWYWTVGFPSDRAPYSYLIFGLMFPFYYTTLGQAVASIVPTAELGALLFSTMYMFVFTFDGVVQPFSQMGWWRWMYRLSPYTYLVEGLIGQAVGGHLITCSDVEYVTVQPPPNQTCAQYMGSYLETAGGYLTNPGSKSNCQYCAFRTTDEYLLATVNIVYSHRWRDLGLFCAYVTVNVCAIYTFSYLLRYKKGSILRWLMMKVMARRK